MFIQITLRIFMSIFSRDVAKAETILAYLSSEYDKAYNELEKAKRTQSIYDNIIVYDGIAPFHNQNFLDPDGNPSWSSALTLEEIVCIAITNQCNIIHRRGEHGKWYLKKPNDTIATIQDHVNRRDTNENYKQTNSNYCLWLLTF